MNRVIHFEIHASDTQKAAAFYRDVFGWDIRKWDNPDFDYWIVMTGPDDEAGGINGGIMGRKGAVPQEGAPLSSYVCTIGVASVDEYVEKVEAEGGKLAVPKMPIPGVGWLVYCKDADGNLFGMMQDDKSAR